MATSREPGREILEGMLHVLPVHVFFFDQELICRFAAPIGQNFFGTHHAELLGRPVEGVFPDPLDLRPQLELVLRTGSPWSVERLPYPPGAANAWPGGAWRV